MIGDDWTATYSCGYEPSGTEATLIGWTGSLPGMLVNAVAITTSAEFIEGHLTVFWASNGYATVLSV